MYKTIDLYIVQMYIHVQMYVNKEKCNCHLETYGGKYKHPMQAANASFKAADVQVVRNFKKIEKNDEIIIFKEQIKKETKPKAASVASAAAQPGAKKARTTK